MPSERIHVYRLIEPLTRGGPGHVWRAVAEDAAAGAGTSVEPGAEVTLRALGEADVGEARVLARLDAMHTAARRITAPSVLAPLDHGLVTGPEATFWSVSRWLAGSTLGDLLAANDIVPDLLLEAITLRLAQAIAASHAAGVVGLGICPEAILLAEGGEAVLSDPACGPVVGVRWPGTGRAPASMMCAAPEVLAGAPPSPASDLFGLGCVLYRCMTGGWHRPEDAEVLRLHSAEMDAARPDGERTQCSIFMSEVAHALLHAEPEDRITEAAGLVRILGERRSGAWWQALGAPGPAEPSRARSLAAGTEPAAEAPARPAPAAADAAPATVVAEPPAATSEPEPRPLPEPARPPDAAWWAAHDVVPEPSARHAAPCVGREVEQRVLADALAAVRHGRGRVVLLAGGAGSGKTRLLDAMIEGFAALPAAERPVVLRGEHRSAGIGRPLGAFTEALTRWLCQDRVVRAEDVAPLLGTASGVAATFAALLSSDTAPPDAPPLSSSSVPAAYMRCLETVAARAPVVLVVENLQWADPEALDLFDFAARNAPELRLLLVGSHRPPGADGADLAQALDALRRRPQVASISLAPLDAEACAQVAAAVVDPPDVASDLAARVHAVAGGVPAALLDTVATLEAEGALERGRHGRLHATPALAAAELPADAAAAGRRRLAALADDDCALLSAACIQGSAFDAEVARRAAVLSSETADAALARLVAAGLVLPWEAAYCFGTEAIFDAVVADLDPRRLASLHGATADAYLACRNPHDLAPAEIHGVLAFRAAWHFLAGGQAARGFPYVDAAVDHLRGTCRHGDGERLTDLAARAAEGMAERAHDVAGLLLERSRFLGAQGRHAEQKQVLDLALTRARERRDLRRESRVLLDLASAPAVLDLPGQADNFAKQALACAHRAGETEVEMRAHIAFAQTAFRQGRLLDARSHWAEAREIATARGDAAATAEIRQGAGLAAQASGAFDQAEAAFREALSAHRARGSLDGEAETLSCLGHLLAATGALPRAEECLRRALRIHAALGDVSGEVRVLGLLAMVLQEGGDLVEARATHSECLVRSRRLDAPASVAVALLNGATVDSFLGRIEDARAAYGEALRVACAVGDVRLQGYALTGLAEVARQTAQYEVARGLVDRAILRFRDSQDPSGLAAALLTSGRTATFGGDDRTAKTHLFEAHRLAEQQSARQVLAVAAALLGLIAARAGDADAAERRAIQAGIEIADLRASDVTRIEILFLHALTLRVLGRPAEADRKILHAETALVESVHPLSDADRDAVLTRLSPNREIFAGAAATRAAAPHRRPSMSDTVAIEIGAV